ncbi:hypothetical protein GPECTOR_11g171 [Gonium pectorale]|uniref:Uncharacterized protein n=1 Tax=Gonium pectorale TaxID=33097 RepID=A0A150GPJ5_GONPE|nr:hypothetical protein GPECTOR_11g171 [Gonium pectorale]|eukprot:KXZ51724.1 hypothetical protein GPECTOR_11g171 [Gonium pectorale]
MYDRLLRRIQTVELFVKFVGPRLAALDKKEAREQALQQLRDFEPSTPPEALVSDLAADELAPTLVDFVDSFDADYKRYLTLLQLLAAKQAEADSGGSGPGRELLVETAHLARFYAEHVRRDLEAVEVQEEAARARGSADEVARRLARGIRLPVRQAAGRPQPLHQT